MAKRIAARHRTGSKGLSVKALHEDVGNRADAWLVSVTTLRDAAKRLKSVESATLPGGTELMVGTDAVFTMLLGYAVECALKGLWVDSGHKLVSGGKFKRIPGISDHDLHGLAMKVGVEASADELDALRRLTPFVRFAGRYPVPIHAAEMSPRRVPGRGTTVPHFYSREDMATAERLLNRLTTRLRIATGDIPSGPWC
jgi:hypothetical protein